MSGIMCALLGTTGGVTLTVTVDSDTFTFPKGGGTINQVGYISASNAVNGAAKGAVSPTTFQGATINGIYFEDDTVTGHLYFRLNGDQRALSVNRIVINGTAYTMGAASFSGGQTTWSATSAVGNNWGGSPVPAVIS